MDIQLPQILFQIVNFSVVVGALTYLLYGPIKKILQERADRIEEGQRAADLSIAEKEKIEQFRVQSEKEAKKNATLILEDAKKDAETQAAEIVAKAQEHAKAQLLKVQAEWQEQKKDMARELKTQFADAVLTTVGKIGLSLDAKAQSKIIDQELEAVLNRI